MSAWKNKSIFLMNSIHFGYIENSGYANLSYSIFCKSVSARKWNY